MHTVVVIASGLLLLAAFVALARARAGAPGIVRAAWWFVPVWLAAALANLSIGVIRAGYPLREELPVFGLVFAVPAIAALAVGLRARGAARH